MDHRLAGFRHGVAFGSNLAEFAANNEQAIRFFDEFVGNAVVAPKQPGAQLVTATDRALAAHGVCNRDVVALGKGAHRIGRIRQMDTAAAQGQRSFCFAE